MTRNGKIARLPRHVRDELNQRLDNGMQGNRLVPWLNSLVEVKKILASDFAGCPISEQNLSQWKQGGFLDWRRQQEVSDRVTRLIERSDDLEDTADDRSIPDRLAAVLAAELAAEAQRLLEVTADPRERWQYLRQALRQLHLLRKGDLWAGRAQMEAARWNIECEKRERDKEIQIMQEAFDSVMAPVRESIRRPALVAAYGGGAEGEKAADFILEMERKYSAPPSSPHPFRRASSPPSGTTKSNSIKPNRAAATPSKVPPLEPPPPDNRIPPRPNSRATGKGRLRLDRGRRGE